MRPLSRVDPLPRHLALRRLGSQPGVLATVAVTVVLATTLLAAGPVLVTGLAESGLRASLEQAAAQEIGVEVEARTSAERALEVADVLDRQLALWFGERMEPVEVVITAGTVRLTGQPQEVVVPVAVDPALTGSTLLDGDGPGGPGTVRLHAEAAAELGVAPGDVLVTDTGVELLVAGTLAPVDVTDRRWWDEPEGRDGVVPGVDFVRVGPMYIDTPGELADVLGEPDPRTRVRVRTLPVLDQVGPQTLPALGRSAAGLEQRIDELLGEGLADQWTVRTPIAETTSESTFALAATRAAVLAAVGQVAVLSLYALGLAGRLLRSGREVETHLVRARGATPRQLGTTALYEGLVLVVPAVLAAPFLAAWLTSLLGRLSIVTGAGLELVGRPSLVALGAAALAGVACLVVLVQPAVQAARRTYAGAKAGQGRRSPVGSAQALGLDLALVAVAGIGIWQLRVSDGPLGELQPSTADDVDLVLVLAPALGLLAGALLVLRLVPGLARAGELLADRVVGLVAGLGGWQVARRPDAVSRPTLLLVIGVAVGVLATTYGATWTSSQDDQADAAIGVPLLLQPDRKVSALPDAVTPVTITSTPGVTAAYPAWDSSLQFTPGAPGGTALAIDAAADPLLMRDDVAPSASFASLDVPALEGLPLPDGDELTLRATLAEEPRWPGFGLEATVILRDGHGLLHRMPDRVIVADGVPQALTWTVGEVSRPVHLLAVELTVEAGNLDGTGYVAPPPEPGGDPDPLPDPPRIDLDLGAPHVDGTLVAFTGVAWQTDPVVSLAAFPAQVDSSQVQERSWRVEGDAGLAGPRGRLATVRAVTVEAATPRPDAVPVVVAPSVLESTGRGLGDDLALQVGGAPMRLLLTGTAPVIPGAVDDRQPVVMDIDAVTAARWATGRVTTRPTAWHVEVDDAGVSPAQRLALSRRLRTELTAAPVAAPSVAAAAIDAASRRADPIAVGLLAALTLGAIAAVVLALLGTVSTAVVSVRERAAEFALLQAVGTSLGQIRVALASEVAVVVLTGLSAGGLLGSVLVWAVLPTIALAADGTIAVPGPVVVVPWPQLLGATTVVVGLFALVPLVLSRIVARAHIAEVLRIGEDG